MAFSVFERYRNQGFKSRVFFSNLLLKDSLNLLPLFLSPPNPPHPPTQNSPDCEIGFLSGGPIRANATTPPKKSERHTEVPQNGEEKCADQTLPDIESPLRWPKMSGVPATVRVMMMTQESPAPTMNDRISVHLSWQPCPKAVVIGSVGSVVCAITGVVWEIGFATHHQR